jgi:hypothetical protein
MTDMIAYCGIKCSECDAYLATQANDTLWQERLAEQWRRDYNSPEITAADVICDGCSVGARHGGYCSLCPVRACAVQRGVSTCAACTDYPCEELTKFHSTTAHAKANLEALRAQM